MILCAVLVICIVVIFLQDGLITRYKKLANIYREIASESFRIIDVLNSDLKELQAAYDVVKNKVTDDINK